MESFSNLEYGVYEEPVLQTGMMVHEEVQHHLAEFVLYRGGEIVQKAEQVLETD